jgi:hypothetical protein
MLTEEFQRACQAQHLTQQIGQQLIKFTQMLEVVSYKFKLPI